MKDAPTSKVEEVSDLCVHGSDNKSLSVPCRVYSLLNEILGDTI